MCDPIRVQVSSVAELRDKIRAYDFGKEPRVRVRGTISTSSGDIAFLNSGADVIAIGRTLREEGRFQFDVSKNSDAKFDLSSK